MSMPKEHDYIGLSETPSMEIISHKLSSSSSSSSSSTSEHNKNSKPNTSLSLGLPGSHSPERKPLLPALSLFGKYINETTNNTANGYCLSPFKNFVSGNKRGFSDAIDGKWGFSACNGPEVELGKGGVLFSPRSDNSATQKSSGSGTGKDDIESVQVKTTQVSAANDNNTAPAAKAQVVGWPPIRSFRKNSMATNLAKNNEDAEAKSGFGCLYVKVSMDGAPYLRKIDLKTYTNYTELSSALEKMFGCFTIGQCGSNGLPGKDGLSETCLKDLLHSSEYVLTYEDKDGDWMLVGDVPWEMFTESCKRLRIMKGSEAIGLAPRAMEKCKNRK